jgi:hypothetical protein
MKIKTPQQTFEVELIETPTSKKIVEQLPLKGLANIWGQEIYFSIPVSCDTEAEARDIMEVGEIAFYPPMNAFCIFFGPTPVSTDERPRAADKVNVLGKIKGNLEELNEVKNGDTIELTS